MKLGPDWKTVSKCLRNDYFTHGTNFTASGLRWNQDHSGIFHNIYTDIWPSMKRMPLWYPSMRALFITITAVAEPSYEVRAGPQFVEYWNLKIHVPMYSMPLLDWDYTRLVNDAVFKPPVFLVHFHISPSSECRIMYTTRWWSTPFTKKYATLQSREEDIENLPVIEEWQRCKSFNVTHFYFLNEFPCGFVVWNIL